MNTNENVKRRVNFRPLLWLFLFAVFATFATANIFVGRIWLFAIFAIIFVFVLAICILSHFKRNIFLKCQKVFGIKNLFAFCLSLVICGALFGGLTSINYIANSKRPFKNSMHSVNAVVREVNLQSDNQSVLLGDVIVDGTMQNFNIKANCDVEVAELKVGDRVDFNVYLFDNSLIWCGEINTNTLKNNVQYYCSIPNGVYVSDGKAHFVDYIKDSVKTLYLNSFDEDVAGMAFAVTMGDKSILSDDTYQIFKDSGLAHILAVSGLHIGFLVAILLFLTKILRIKPKIRFWIVAFVLLLYNILCGFSPSVFRASIMSLCLMLGLILGERNDSLSNLSLAGLIVLICQPLNLFDVGFLLSFSAVFGILFFQRKFSRAMCKIHIPKFLSDAVAMTVSATIGTFPFVCKYFGYFAPISLLSNLIVLPIFTLSYYLLLPSTLLGLIFGSNILVVSNFMFNVVLSTSAFFAKFGTIQLVKFDTLCCVLYYFIIFFASPYFMLRLKSKFICLFAMILAFNPILIIVNLPKHFDYDSISFCERANDTCFITTKNDQKILLNVGKNKNGYSHLKTMFSKDNVKEIDVLILTNYRSSFENNLNEILQRYSVKSIAVVDNLSVSEKLQLEKVCSAQNLSYFTENSFDICTDVHIYTYFEDAKQKAINIQFDDINFLFMLGAVSVENLENNAIFDQSFDMVATNTVTDLRYETLVSKNFATFNLTVCDNNFSLIDDLWTINF